MWLQLVYRCLPSVSDGETVFRDTCELGFEGIVSKRLALPFRPLAALDQEQEPECARR